MSFHHTRGNVLIFVLMLIAIIMLIIYAGTTLQPLQAKALDQHLHALTLQAALDSATEEALANLDSARSPEFSKEITIDGRAIHIFVKQVRAKSDNVELQLSSQLSGFENETLTLHASVAREGAKWQVTSPHAPLP